MPDSRQSSSPEPVSVDGSLVRSGHWSKSLSQVAADSVELRRLLAGDRIDDARVLVQSKSAEEQAALVALDADPEQVLALTGADRHNHPAYRREVVGCLPSQLLAQLVAPGTKHSRYNPEILRAMSPEVFDALWEAAPELLTPAVVNATKRLYGI